jgi:hypothetical protein
MTAGELRKALEDVPDERLVVLARDEEGNGFSPLAEVVSTERYFAETTYFGEIVHPDDYGEMGDDYVLAVVLWPLN